MREVFVYYRVRREDADAVRRQVASLHAELRLLAPQLDARLLHRPLEADGVQTWMETYAIDAAAEPAGVSAVLQAEIESRAARLLTAVLGPRHVEVFIVAAPPKAAR